MAAKADRQQKKDGLGATISRGVRGFGHAVSSFFKEIGAAFSQGDWRTRTSFIIMGFGCFTRKQFVKGLIYFAVEVLFILYMVFFGAHYLQDIGTLGTNLFDREWDEANQIWINIPGDNSMLILLYSVLSIFLCIFFLVIYFSNIRAAWQAQQMQTAGKKLPNFKKSLLGLLDEKLHVTLLTPPAIGVLMFTVLPVVFMICLAFTNFDRNHQPPGHLFTWVGLDNFKDIFGGNQLKSYTFFSLLLWTVIWAIFSTFINYFLGMLIALMINKKGIKLKGLWRTLFVVSIAVPAFVTLLLMRNMLQDAGTINVLLQDVLGWTDAPIHFLTDGTLARITVIIVNYWIGIPYSIIITSGILMNIPADLYESARIDGAGPWKQFTRITTPYMLFITTPYLITQFIQNFNNFNAIYFLTAGGPQTLAYYQAGSTDLLVTWLYKLTVQWQDYNLASTIGILVFVICAVISLATFNLTASAKREETFQ
ncbi:MAG: sugar ABC transporter permease [Ruminococcaceae bacterium]|nr:sugar ABC transporter permease [Oscillospiraceae bacterium]